MLALPREILLPYPTTTRLYTCTSVGKVGGGLRANETRKEVFICLFMYILGFSLHLSLVLCYSDVVSSIIFLWILFVSKYTSEAVTIIFFLVIISYSYSLIHGTFPPMKVVLLMRIT